MVQAYSLWINFRGNVSLFSSSISLSSCLYLRSIAHSALLCTDILRFSLVNDDRRRNKRAEIIVEKKTFQGTGKEVLPANLFSLPADFSK